MNILGIQIGKQAVPTTITRAGTGDGLLESTMKACLSSSFTLSAALGVQTAFPTTCDVWTLEANTTYEVEGSYFITTGTTTARSVALAFLAGGSLTISSMAISVSGANTTNNTAQTTSARTKITQLASVVVTPSATSGGAVIEFRGHIRINVGGTITPQINFSANPGGTNTMDVNSWIKFTPNGDGSFLKIGSVA
jgi:hypothetical protein